MMQSMERKEAIKVLKDLSTLSHIGSLAGEDIKALEMAISSLETDEAYQLEYERTTKNDLGVDCISRDSAIKALDYDIKNFEFKSGVSKHMDDIAKLLNIIYETQVDNIKALPSVTPQEPQTFKWCTDCREYDQEKHCCHRWSKVIRDTVEEMKQEPRWIPVSEKLPDTDDEVLCWYEYYHWSEEEILPEYGIGQYIVNGWYGEVGVGKNVRVIAWMPLPKPYEPQETEDT